MQNENNKPEMSETDRVRYRKAFVIKSLQEKFSETLWRERLLKICGGDESRILKAVQSFVAYISNDDGGREGRKRYIADCTLGSITGAFLESFQMGIEVGGGRDHAYLVAYDNQCELEISYKGFVYALGKHFDNPFVIAECVFDGDEFTSHITENNATFSHKPSDPFKKSWATMRGCYCYFSYTQRDSGEKVSRLVMIQKEGADGLEMIRSKSKGSKAWADFPFEQCKKSTCRRAAKIPFAQIDFGDEDVNPETVDNKHYQLENSSSRLALLMDKQKEIHTDEKKDEPKDAGKITPAPAPPQPGEAGDSEKTPQAVISPAPEPAPPMADQGAVARNDDPPPHTDDGERYADISEADFGEADEVKQQASTQFGQILTQALAEAQTPLMTYPASMQGLPSESEPEIIPPTKSGGWDGQTIMIGGCAQKNDFPSAIAAGVYVKKVMSQRKHKASRQSILNENRLLIAELEQQGKHDTIAELRKVASQGE